MRWALTPVVLTSAPTQQATLAPPGTSVELRTYGFGLFPFDGNFTRLHGWMRYTPSNTAVCQVMLEIEAESLAMANGTIRDLMTGPEMMDTARFPNLLFEGAIEGDAVAGELTMHGETHPVRLAYTRSAGTVTATGELKRAGWGITGNPLIGGSVIRIKVVLPDPFAPRHA